jgi:hypothetical protein
VTHGVGGEGPKRQPRPLDRALTLFDPVLSRAALVVEGDNSPGRMSQIRLLVCGRSIDRHQPSAAELHGSSHTRRSA